jgi:hypothetical protein
VLIRRLLDAPACFFLNGQPISSTHDDMEISRESGTFRIRTQVSTPNISVSLRTGKSASYEISGSPFLVDHLVSVQGLDAYFGRADHKRKRVCDNLPNKRRRPSGSIAKLDFNDRVEN